MTTRHSRLAIVALLLLALGISLGGFRSQPAAAAGVTLNMKITGNYTVFSWDTTENTIAVTNPNSVGVTKVFVEIYDYSLPIDYTSIVTRHNGALDYSACQITDGWGMSSKTRAVCSLGTLGAGQTAYIYLTGGTTAVWGSGSAYMYARAYVNYPTNTTSNGSASYKIAWNP